MIKKLENFFLEFCYPIFAADVELITNQKWSCLIKSCIPGAPRPTWRQLHQSLLFSNITTAYITLRSGLVNLGTLWSFWVSLASQVVWTFRKEFIYLFIFTFYIYLFYVYESSVCMYGCASHALVVDVEVRTGCQIPWNWSHRWWWAGNQTKILCKSEGCSYPLQHLPGS